MDRFTLLMLLAGLVLGGILGGLTRGGTWNTVAFAIPGTVLVVALFLPQYAGVSISTASGIFTLGLFGYLGVVVVKIVKSAVSEAPRKRRVG